MTFDKKDTLKVPVTIKDGQCFKKMIEKKG